MQTNNGNDNPDQLADLQQKQDDEEEDNSDDDDNDKNKKAKPATTASANKVDTTYYDYLINMSLRNLTKERRNDILKEQQEKHEKLEALQKKLPVDLYDDDLEHFEAEYHKVNYLLLQIIIVISFFVSYNAFKNQSF